ncbi:MAG: Gfo/Idh/MocA family oxidoreductase [Acidobacteriota bacterium]|nr:Gfo/Idh/MocA family oxidoreductase [Acidobacteriota bacterium]
MLRWGILGTARINRRVIPAIRLAPRSELVAIASRTRPRAEAYASEWQIPKVFAGYQALIDDPAIDAVYIPLPNSEHVPWTLAAVAAGKHVLCEKPMALDPDDVDHIHAAAATAKVVVEEGYMYRHEPLTAKVQDLVHSGALGTVRAIVSGFTFALTNATDPRLDPALGGGSLWDVGCYPVTYAGLLAGRDPKMVFGSAHWHATGVDAEFMGMLRFPGGTTATIYSGFRAALRTWLEVIGSEGSLTVPNPFKPGIRETLELERNGRIAAIEVAGSPELFVRQIEHFEHSALDGAPSVVTLADSRAAAATLSALLDSARDTTALYPQ